MLWERVLFRLAKLWLSRETLLAMYDPSPQRGPQTPGEKLFVRLLVMAIASFLLAELAQDFTPAKLSVLFFFLFWCPLLVLHEAGHALMAWSLGWSVEQIVIGMGEPLKRFKLGKVPVEWRMVPIEGFVRCRPRNLERPRLKNALVYFAGPGIELLLAALILLLVGQRLLQPSNAVWVIAVQALAAASVASGVINLIPFSAETPDRKIVNDGLGILLALFTPKEHYLAQMKAMLAESDQGDR